MSRVAFRTTTLVGLIWALSWMAVNFWAAAYHARTPGGVIFFAVQAAIQAVCASIFFRWAAS